MGCTFKKERNNNNNEIQIKDNIDANLESNSNSLIIEEREIKLNDGKKTYLQFVSTADMQKDAKDLSLKFLPYSLLISILFSTIISLIYAKLIKNNLQEIKIDINREYGKNLMLKSFASFCISAVETNCRFIFSPSLSVISLSSIIKELLSLSKLTFISSLICISFLLFFSYINAFISLLFE